MLPTLSFGKSIGEQLGKLFQDAVNKTQFAYTPNKSIELECRIGVPGEFKSRSGWEFKSDISKDFFMLVKSRLDKITSPIISHSKVIIKTSTSGSTIRKIETESSTEYQIKSHIDSITCPFLAVPMNKRCDPEKRNVYMFRASLAEEEIGPHIQAIYAGSQEIKTRDRQRYSYNFNNNYVIDMTIIDANAYEIELEYSKKLLQSVDLDKLNDPSYLFSSIFFPGIKFLFSILFPGLDRIYGIIDIIDRYQYALSISYGKFNNFDEAYRKHQVPRPKNIAVTDISDLESGYSWTNKLNGVFSRLLITNIDLVISGKIISIFVAFAVSTTDIRYLTTGEFLEKYINTLADMEYFIWDERAELHIFDCLVYNGHNYTTYSHDKRINVLRPALPTIQAGLQKVDIHAEIKNFFYTPPSHDHIGQSIISIVRYMYARYGNKIELANDGILAQPFGQYKDDHNQIKDKAYYTALFPIYKWKFPIAVSIDFLIIESDIQSVSRIFKLYVSDDSFDHRTRMVKRNLTLFGSYTMGHVYNPPSEILINSTNPFYNILQSGQIVECGIDRETGQFNILRIRPDKTRPNSKKVAELTFIDMAVEFSLPLLLSLIRKENTHIEKSKINCLDLYRQIPNEIKRSLIKQYATGKKVLDLGTGKGGDLHKYYDAKITRLWAVEPNNNYINGPEGLKERISKFPMAWTQNIVIINKSAQDTSDIISELVKYTPSMANIVSSFFSLGFLFKDKNTLTAFCNTVNSNLENGGYFIGTMLDGEKIYNALKANGGSISSTEGKCWTFNSKYNLSLPLDIGLEIGLNLMDTPTVKGEQIEWLVPFNMLEAELNKYNFKLISSVYFDDASLLNTKIKDLMQSVSIDAKIFGSFYRTFVFQKLATIVPAETDRDKKRKENILKNSLESIIKIDEAQLGQFIDPAIYPHELYRVGVIGKGSCFFHSLLYLLTGRHYTDKTITERKTYVTKIRSLLADRLTAEILMILGNGDLITADLDFFGYLRKRLVETITNDRAELVLNRISQESSFIGQRSMLIKLLENYGYSDIVIQNILAEAITDVLVKYQDKLRDCEAWTEFNTIEYIMRSFNINIFIITDTERCPQPIVKFSLYDENKKCIIILNLEGLNPNLDRPAHFEPICDIIQIEHGKYLQTCIFEWTHPLVQSLVHSLKN